MESKSGTISGWKDVQIRTINSLKQWGVQLSKKNFDDFWKTYEKLKEVSPEISNKKLKYEVLKEISNAIKQDIPPDEIVRKMQKRLDAIYEEQAELMDDGVSGFFEI